jgi:hypothetical protein
MIRAILPSDARRAMGPSRVQRSALNQPAFPKEATK